MIPYFSVETCEILQAAGCETSFGMYFGGGDGPYGPFKDRPRFSSNETCTTAFHPWDFMAETEQAEKNRKIVWPNLGEYFHRFKMVEAKNPEAYLLATWSLGK